MRSKRPRFQLLLISAFAVAVSAGPSRAQVDQSDPWEPANRKLYAFHMKLDRAFIKPVAHAFARLPKPLRKAMRNFSSNLGEPVVFVNDLLQGHVGTAASTLGRFTINTTVGVGGVFDVAAKGRIPHHDNGFGTTLGRWGAHPGPYMFIPLVGPSSVRDAFGGIVNVFLSPHYYLDYPARPEVSTITTVDNGLERRLDAQQALTTIEETSTDPYATLRSYFQQTREADIHGAINPTNLPEFDTPDMPSTPEPQGAPQTGPEPQLPPMESEPEPAEPAAPPAPAGTPSSALEPPR